MVGPSKRYVRMAAIVAKVRSGLTTADALADALGVSVRSVYRDIRALQTIGMQIQGERGVGYIMRERRHG